MQRSKTEFHYHFVWATYKRTPLITAAWEQNIHDCIQHEAVRQNVSVIALGGMADHVHLAATLPPRLAVSQFMQRIKGVSSTFVRQTLAAGEFFGWQDHYAAFSISRSHINRVVRYIENQKQHHAEGTVWAEWEETEEETQVNQKPGV